VRPHNLFKNGKSRAQVIPRARRPYGSAAGSVGGFRQKTLSRLSGTDSSSAAKAVE
jgi:hypothetical protein